MFTTRSPRATSPGLALVVIATAQLMVVLDAKVEDLEAVLAESGASRVFGVSIGGLIALETARTPPTIPQVAAYEPALLAQPDRHTAWVQRFDQKMARGGFTVRANEI